MKLFQAGRFCATELVERDVGDMQQLFNANPDYHLLAAGRPPTPSEAREAFEARPPFPYGKRWFVAIRDERGRLVGIADLLADIFAPRVWTLAWYLLENALHGTGAAAEVYTALEAWMRREGAAWSRLGVVEGNARAAAFWRRKGYVEVRRREGVPYGERINTLIVMVKPLAGGTLADYSALVARDRPLAP